MTTAWTTKSFVDLLIKHHNDIDDKSPVFLLSILQNFFSLVIGATCLAMVLH